MQNIKLSEMKMLKMNWLYKSKNLVKVGQFHCAVENTFTAKQPLTPTSNHVPKSDNSKDSIYKPLRLTNF